MRTETAFWKNKPEYARVVWTNGENGGRNNQHENSRGSCTGLQGGRIKIRRTENVRTFHSGERIVNEGWELVEGNFFRKEYNGY